MKALPIAALFLGCLLLFPHDVLAQRDFLSADEVDKVREVQEPNERLQLYVLFARQRVDRLKQTLSKDKKGRSLLVRELLEDYAKIVDAIDTVSDDALKRKIDITAGAAAVSHAEKSFLDTLTKIQENPPHDFDLYDAAFKEAIENTRDSIDLASSDLAARQTQVIEKAEQEKEAVKSVLTAKEVKEREAEQKKVDGGENVRKPPTLYRKGEKPDSQTAPGKQTAPVSKPPQL